MDILSKVVKNFGLENEVAMFTHYLGWLEHVNCCLGPLAVLLGMEATDVPMLFGHLTHEKWLFQVWHGKRSPFMIMHIVLVNFCYRIGGCI